jgi:hypothetical protein
MNSTVSGAAMAGSRGRLQRWFTEVGPGLRIQRSDRRAARKITRLLMARIQVSDDGEEVVRSTIPAMVTCRRGAWDIEDEELVRSLVCRLFERACRRTGVDVGRLSLAFVEEPLVDAALSAGDDSKVGGPDRDPRFALSVVASWSLDWAPCPEAVLSCGGPSVRLSNPFALDRRTVSEIVSGGVVKADVDRVSRDHAEIRRWRGRWAIRDLGSKHGTTVDGCQIGEALTPLRSGAVITIASEFEFLFETGT